MSEDDFENDDANEPNAIATMRKRIKALEAEAKRAEEADARATAAERKLVIAEAGIKLNARQMTALTSVHDGEWDAESLKATAIDLGFMQPADPEPTPELDAHDRVARAAAGGGVPANRMAEYEAAMAQTKSAAEAIQVAQQFGVRTTLDHRP